jgi:hypothetical protein
MIVVAVKSEAARVRRIVEIGKSVLAGQNAD